MATYYEILGVSPSADLTQIRAAYKRLAFQYHPDLHPNDKEAEERFKMINEAYHTLSDPVKKSRYDARLSASILEHDTSYEEQAWRAYRYRQYMRWKAAQESQYVLGKQYFKIQGLAFLVFLIIAGFSYGLIYTVKYIQDVQFLRQVERNEEQVKRVHALFASGKIDAAFRQIKLLIQQNPFEYRFGQTYDSLLQALRYRAQQEYRDSNFDETLVNLRLLKLYENPARFETLRLKAICEYQTQQYDSALTTLEAIRNMQPWNFELVYQMGIIGLDNLGDPQKALVYLNEGKKMFKESMSRIYGEAFEVVMNPADAPDIYYHLFEARARANMQIQNFEEALTDCNWAIFLRPVNSEAWKMRALCRIALNRPYRLCDDLLIARKLGASGIMPLQRKYCP